jgi:hypothetical protein
MTFRDIDYKGKKPKIRSLLRLRADIKRRIIYHKNKIEHHQNQIKKIEETTLKEVEEQLKIYLD